MNNKGIEIAYFASWQINPHAGMLVAVEGKDGSGQTTLIDRLTDGLSRKNVRLSVGKEPTDGPFGSPIRAALTHRLKIDLNTLQLGFSADRSDDLNKEGGS